MERDVVVWLTSQTFNPRIADGIKAFIDGHFVRHGAELVCETEGSLLVRENPVCGMHTQVDEEDDSSRAGQGMETLVFQS